VSTPDKPDPARGWQFIEKLLADDAVEPLGGASDEEVERQMNALDIDVTGMATAEELIARVEARAKKRQAVQAPAAPATVRSLPRPRLIAWLAAAAIGALVVALVVERREVVAWFQGDLPPGPTPPGQEPPSNALVRAETLRREALAACEEAQWGECESKLDAAKALDAKGETDALVRTARQAIEASKRPGPPRKAFPDTK
jgi:hypothetical protein